MILIFRFFFTFSENDHSQERDATQNPERPNRLNISNKSLTDLRTHLIDAEGECDNRDKCKNRIASPQEKYNSRSRAELNEGHTPFSG